MTRLTLTKTRLSEGVWEGVLTGATHTPRIEVLHEGLPLPGPELREIAGGQFAVRLPLPPAILRDGAQTLIFRDAACGAQLAHFTLIAGEAPGDDVRAELDLLRAELDLLKRAFRRHCTETGS